MSGLSVLNGTYLSMDEDPGLGLPSMSIIDENTNAVLYVIRRYSTKATLELVSNSIFY